MSDFIFGARTLIHFTEAIDAGFKELGITSHPGFELYQVHGSPLSVQEDLELLKRAKLSNSKKIFLIHRPDELLLSPKLTDFFIQHPQASIVFLGDLVLELDFWKSRKDFIHVVNHPFLSLELPVSRNNKYVIGSFTSWGEMRKLEHFVELAKKLPQDQFEFMVGGSLDGRPLMVSDIPEFMKLSQTNFVPHFNVQLYHLHGKKRIGESSGSLHRGVTVPVIFEANGMEKNEGLKVIKVEANDDLTEINFKQAAEEICQSSTELGKILEHNKKRASLNRPSHFAQKILDIKIK